MMRLTRLVPLLNKQLTSEYKFKLNLIHSTPIKENGTEVLSFLGFEDSISKDMSVVPENLKQKVFSNTNCYKLVKWINEKLFTSVLYQLQNNLHPNIKVAEIRLRIAVNMISKQSILSKTEQNEWIGLLQSIFYARNKSIYNYYLTEIEQVPF